MHGVKCLGEKPKVYESILEKNRAQAKMVRDNSSMLSKQQRFWAKLVIMTIKQSVGTDFLYPIDGLHFLWWELHYYLRETAQNMHSCNHTSTKKPMYLFYFSKHCLFDNLYKSKYITNSYKLLLLLREKFT